MNLVQGIIGDCFFESQHEKISPKAQKNIHIAQQRILHSMATIQITLAQFQAPIWGYLRKSPYSGCECFKVDDFENRSTVDGFGVEGNPSYRTPLDFYNPMIAERARRLDTTSVRKILNTIRKNLSFAAMTSPAATSHMSTLDLETPFSTSVVSFRLLLMWTPYSLSQ